MALKEIQGTPFCKGYPFARGRVETNTFPDSKTMSKTNHKINIKY